MYKRILVPTDGSDITAKAVADRGRHGQACAAPSSTC